MIPEFTVWARKTAHQAQDPPVPACPGQRLHLLPPHVAFHMGAGGLNLDPHVSVSPLPTELSARPFFNFQTMMHIFQIARLSLS